MESPAAVADCLIAGDGGSVWFRMLDARGREHSFVFPQSVIAENRDPGVLAGALPFDGRVPAVGGEEEKEILAALAAAHILPPAERKEIIVRNEEIVVPQTAEMREETRAFIARMVERAVSSAKIPGRRRSSGGERRRGCTAR